MRTNALLEMCFVQTKVLLLKLGSADDANLTRALGPRFSWARQSPRLASAPLTQPSTGRSTWCIYWCMREWPEFFRHRELGWLSLGFLRTSMVEGIAGGIANVVRKLLRVMFGGPGFSFDVGCRCPLVGEPFLVQGRQVWQLRHCGGALACAVQ
jgi:hypothetical protein